MADVARFVSVDPLAEDFVYLTTYQYASNSPIFMIDLDGLEGVQFHEYVENDNGQRQLSKITYKLDVFVVTGAQKKGNAADQFGSTFTKGDVDQIKENLTFAFQGDHTDPQSGASVIFEFNVNQLDLTTTNKKGKEVPSKPMEGEIITKRNELSSKNEEGRTIFPALIFEQKLGLGNDGGETKMVVRLDPQPKAGKLSAGHEVLHFMLSLFDDPRGVLEKNSFHHTLGGLLGRPIDRSNLINDDILNALRESVPLKENY